MNEMTIELYKDNAYIKECETNIRSVKGNTVVFEQTIFYPGGGGQPCDKGVVKHGNETYEVMSVKNSEGQIIHELDRPLQNIQEPVFMKIDWEWRMKNMRYHTLLHVIAGYLYENYKGMATSSQIETDYGRLEIAFPPEIMEEIQFDQLEQAIQNVLAQPHNVETKTVSRQEAEQKEGAIKTIINLLPASLNEVRIVKIEDIDEQACGGTHLKNTSEIGNFSITKIQKKGALKRRIRVELN